MILCFLFERCNSAEDEINYVSFGFFSVYDLNAFDKPYNTFEI